MEEHPAEPVPEVQYIASADLQPVEDLANVEVGPLEALGCFTQSCNLLHMTYGMPCWSLDSFSMFRAIRSWPTCCRPQTG